MLYGRLREVMCLMANTGRLRIAAEESADLLWLAPSGAIVSIRLDYLTRRARRRMIALGDTGELEWDAIANRVDIRLAEKDATSDLVTQSRNEMMQAQAEAFIRGANGGESGVLATFDEGAFAVALCDAARRSSQSGRLEMIRDWRET